MSTLPICKADKYNTGPSGCKLVCLVLWLSYLIFNSKDQLNIWAMLFLHVFVFFVLVLVFVFVLVLPSCHWSLIPLWDEVRNAGRAREETASSITTLGNVSYKILKGNIFIKRTFQEKNFFDHHIHKCTSLQMSDLIIIFQKERVQVAHPEIN